MTGPIRYDEQTRALPCDKLHRLFVAVGWTDPDDLTMLPVFNRPFIGSALVVSAWDGDELVGAVRVLSDGAVRAVVYDLAVLPAYQRRGIGRELLRRCMAHWPKAEWLVQTTEAAAGFYERLGLTRLGDVFLHRQSEYWN